MDPRAGFPVEAGGAHGGAGEPPSGREASRGRRVRMHRGPQEGAGGEGDEHGSVGNGYMDYPPEKLAVYLSDDGGAAVTLYAMKEACVFAQSWLPFCRKYGIKTRCPEAFFSSFGEVEREVLESGQFKAQEEKIESKYKVFKRNVEKAAEIEESVTNDRPPHVEVIYDNKKNGEAMDDDQSKLPLLVYVCREKRQFLPNRFKAGALNSLGPQYQVLSDLWLRAPNIKFSAICSQRFVA
ncbi:hypothetical protein C2S53_006300 [Perilla frutescens var. hirtella]|uniref:Uncharacterized protein n=1 Tax=Perilla frutescens var. hirtella TaxID=608512 RepID=A0AAD4IX32_PERFH|nr:hypothetical protein C2S53_006300 [Perilla frutescens var. hirtella]